MKTALKRREFLAGSAVSLLGLLALRQWPAQAQAAKLTDKDVLKEGAPAPVANYCEHPEKQPNKICSGAKDRPGTCSGCQFYMTTTETTYKGAKVAKCQLIPTGASYVKSTSWCATFVKKA